jgi:hypothetical protein
MMNNATDRWEQRIKWPYRLIRVSPEVPIQVTAMYVGSKHHLHSVENINC